MFQERTRRTLPSLRRPYPGSSAVLPLALALAVAVGPTVEGGPGGGSAVAQQPDSGPPPVADRADVPAPAEVLGFTPGEHRRLATWDELTRYYSALAESSPRVRVDTLGRSTRGRPFLLLTITSPENHGRLERLRTVQARLADPRTIESEAERERLLEEGRAVVLVTHAIHSTEVGSALSGVRLAHRLAASDDPRVLDILDRVVVLHVPALNPDGTDEVARWYREWVGTEYEGAPLPWLYHHYTGHDLNRDWYAMTQEETRLTVGRVHERWHPHVVHDIHQMGSDGPRIFFPPYVDPWEPNVDPALTASVNQLGMYAAADLVARGREGVVGAAIYDAFTPARAYQHYHGGARILSETASARLATPIRIEAEELESRRGVDPLRRTWNHPRPWGGGEWGLPQIVTYMEEGAMALLTHAARNRRWWLESFLGIGRRAVEGWDEWPAAWVVPAGQDPTGTEYLLRVLVEGGVEVERVERAFGAGGRAFPAGSWLVRMRQPYAAFAQTLLERQEYPELREYPGGPPQRPYDVTAHTLPLLLGVEAVALESPPGVEGGAPVTAPRVEYRLPDALERTMPRIGIYKPWGEPMEAGWTRWLFDVHGLGYDTVSAADVRAGGLAERFDVLLFQSQSPERIVEGLSAEGPPGRRVPPDYAGGIGEEGRRALRAFVRGGGRVVAVERAADLFVDLLDLGVENAVERLPAEEFYVPGSILLLEVEPGDPLTEGTPPETAAWYWRSSRAFRVLDPAVDVVARYGEGDPLLSGWLLGPGHLAGRPALVRAPVGRGSVVLFGFQPNYRGQSAATWRLLFHALAGAEDTP